MFVYIASPLFNDMEIDLIKKVEAILDSKGIKYFSPRLHQFDNFGTREWSMSTFINDIKGINQSDIVIAIMHGNYSDSGTAMEVGYAYGTNKPVIAVHVGKDSNLMIHESAHANITLNQLYGYDFEEMPSSFYTGKMF